MDPNANIEELVDLVSNYNCLDDMERIVELVSALDEWLSKGGFLPDRWKV